MGENLGREGSSKEEAAKAINEELNLEKLLECVDLPRGRDGWVGQLSKTWSCCLQYLHSIIEKTTNLWPCNLQFVKKMDS